MQNITRNFDSRLEHRAIGSAALTATTTLDTIQQRVAQRTRYVMQVVLEAIKVSAGNEHYEFIVEVSNDDFTKVEVAAYLSLGATGARLRSAPDNAAGDTYEVPFSTEINETLYKDWRIVMVASGTSPSITAAVWSGLEHGV